MKYKKEDIIDAIVKMRIEKGASTKTIIQEFLMTELGYKQSYSYQLLQEARGKIVELYDTQNKELANEALGHLESMYEDAIKGKNMKLALDIRKEISKMTGLYAAQKVDITSGGEVITEIKLIQIKSKDDLDGGIND
jgi:uncharacterized protein (DUF1015 family)